MKIFNTFSGIVIQHEDQYFLSKEIDWNNVVNHTQLYQFLLKQLRDLKPDAAFASLVNVGLKAPIGSQEVWASGVTYLRSREARMEESKDAGGGDFLCTCL